MTDKKINGTTIVDRAKLEALRKQREEELAKAEASFKQLQKAMQQTGEQVIGLKHRVNELAELLK